MDSQAFDRLTRQLAEGATRRSVLRTGIALAGAALGLGAAGGADARWKLPNGYTCIRDSACASGYCGPADETGRRRCQCNGPEDCPAPANPCAVAACIDGACAEMAGNAGAVCGTPFDACSATPICDGVSISCPPAVPTCTGGNICVNGQCAPACVPIDGPCNLLDPGVCCSKACKSLSGGFEGKCFSFIPL